MRFADTGEAKELARMAREIWMEHFPKIIGKENTEYILNKFQSESAITEQINDGYLYSFIMYKDEKVGYFSIRPEGDSLFMSKIYVLKRFRGKGLGSKTLDDILQKGKALNVKKVYLHVNKKNSSAISVYEHKGFIKVKDEMTDIGEGFFLDDYLMEYTF